MNKLILHGSFIKGRAKSPPVMTKRIFRLSLVSDQLSVSNDAFYDKFTEIAAVRGVAYQLEFFASEHGESNLKQTVYIQNPNM